MKEHRMRRKGKPPFITGGNSGIGLPTARPFIPEGVHVATTGRSQQTLDAAAAELGPTYCRSIRADLHDIPAIDPSMSEAVQGSARDSPRACLFEMCVV
jgi:NADP-dependent 3-hydroxy acid dehydrogenase YdfG